MNRDFFSFSLSEWKDFITTTSASVSEASVLHAGNITAHNESWAQSWDQVGHPCQRRPRHSTQGPTQVQTKADPSIQEQAPKEGHPGVCCECFLLLQGFRNYIKLAADFQPFSLQFWWWYPWNGGLRHRWVHCSLLNPFRTSSMICDGLNRRISVCFAADITVICPWEAFNHLELHELAQYGIIWAFPHLPAILWGLQATSMHYEPSASGSVSKLYHGTLFQTNSPPVTNTKIGKREKKHSKKTNCRLSPDSSSDAAAHTHLLMFRKSHLLVRSALLLQASFSLLLLFSSSPLFYSSHGENL